MENSAVMKSQLDSTNKQPETKKASILSKHYFFFF